jgi:uncharacterized repeat protein (TIGR01451 family)
MTFGEFSQRAAGSDFSFTNNGGTSGSFNTGTGGSAVLFTLENIVGSLPADLQGSQNAHVFLTSSTTTPATPSGTDLNQPLDTVSTLRVVRDTPAAEGSGNRTNLLTVQFTGTISGAAGGDSAILSGGSAGDTVTFTSDFLDFSSATERDLTLSHSSLLPSLTLGPGGFLADFTASGVGNFRSDAAPALATDLQVTKTGPATAVAGSQVTYTIVVSNNGPKAAQGVALSDQLPAGETLVSQRQTLGPMFTLASSGNGTIVSDTIDSLDSGASATIEVTVLVGSGVTSGTSLSNTATVSTTDYDSDPGNNSSTANTTVSTSADVQVVKTGPTSALAGDNLTYTIKVRNNGLSDALDVHLNDVIPATTTFVSDSQIQGPTFTQSDPPVGGTGTIDDSIATLQPGVTGTFLVVVHVNAGTSDGTVIENIATVTTATSDPDATNNGSSASTTIMPPPDKDFGDAPDSYGTLLASNGARHVAIGPTLGPTRTAEIDGQPNATATGDTGDDGVTIGTLTIGTTQTITINAAGVTGTAFVNAWIDFNQNGVFDPGEQVLTNRAVTNGDNSVVIQVPLDAKDGTTFGRFRLTSASVDNPSPVGLLPDGEVEDYQIPVQRLMDFGDAPDSYGTTLAHNGAGHVYVGVGPYLGTPPTTEPDGQPSVNADADASDDGIAGTALRQGGTATLTIVAPLGGRLDAFIDFNANGVFDADERVTPAGGALLTPGTNTLTISAPPDAVAGDTYARFRVSTAGGLGPTGLAYDGEVEDFRVTILSGVSRITGFVYKELSKNGVRNVGEPGLPGVTVTLNGTNDLGQTVSRPAVTDGTGAYSFDDLRPGTYRLTEAQPAGYSDGLDSVGTPFGGTAAPLGQDEISNIVIPAGSGGLVGAEYDFGERGTSLTGGVFVDANRDGVRDATDSPLGGVSITLLDANGVVVDSNTSLIGGAYEFDDLAAGNYTLVETQPAGYGTSTATMKAVTVPLTGLANQNFGVTASTLAGKVYVDANNNGAPDAGEPGVAGVVVQLAGTDANGQPVSLTATTSADGSYLFTGLLAGSYSVTAPTPTNYTAGVSHPGSSGGTAGSGVISAIALGADIDATGYNFGEGGTIVSGRVDIDANRNGTADAGETGLAGQSLSLRDSAGDVVALATTQADGSYVFNLTALGFQPGAYTITESQPAGYGSSEAPTNSRTVTVPAAGVGGQNFGETTGSLSGFVYRELSLDGVKQAGEPGIPGVFVRLIGKTAAGAPVDVSTFTAGDGSYHFDNILAPDSSGYAIYEAQPAGFLDGLDRRGTIGAAAVGVTANDAIYGIALGGGQVGVNYNFGERVNAGRTFVSGTVFTDSNADGVLQAGESGLGGVTVRLKQGSSVVATMTTRGNGTYFFANFLPGTYTIEEVQPAGYDRTSPITITASVPAAGLLGQDFGVAKGSLGGFVYVDANNNGVRDSGEVGIAGVTLTLTGTDANGAVSRTATTGADGSYSFAGVLAGTYSLAETQPGGFADGAETPGSSGGTANPGGANDVIGSITLTAGAQATNYDFGELQSGLSGHVYADLNADGTRQDGEPGIKGAVVTVTGPVTRSVTSASDGSYRFTDLPAGNYTISESLPAPLTAGQATAGSVGGTANPGGTAGIIDDVTLPPNANATGYDFGERGTVVTGRVYIDANANGTLDANETGLAGVPLVLRDSANNTVALGATGPDGSYVLAITTPGNYTLEELQPTGYGSSEVPSNVRNLTVPAAGLFGQNFGDTLSSLAGAVYQDANGDGVRNLTETLGVAGVQITLTGTDDAGQSVSRTTHTDADGGFSFTGLLSGTYALTESKPAGFFDGLETVGSAGGTPANDVISAIALPAATNAAGYLFGELAPVATFGYVFHDANNNGVLEQGESPIAGVVIGLVGTAMDPNASGGARTFNPATDDPTGGEGLRTTDATGFWQFTGLPPGNYAVGESQPAGWVDGKEQLGDPVNAGLVPAGQIAVSNDVFSNIFLLNEQVTRPGLGTRSLAFRGPLNFGELVPNSISGHVFTDSNLNFVHDAADQPVAGALVLLTGVDDQGNVVRLLTRTNAAGAYTFPNLRPSNGNGYVVTMLPPTLRLARESYVGSLGGGKLAKNQVRVALGSVQGVNGVNYDFALELAILGRQPLIGR